MNDAVKAGWALPINARKAHFYVGDMSLCRKWTIFGGQLSEHAWPDRETCKACRREHDKQSRQGKLFK